MRVLMMPDYRPDNPYQQLLVDALGTFGVEVHFPAGYRRVFPFWRAWRTEAPNTLFHLHWLTPYLKGHGLLSQTVYGLKLLLDLTLLRLSGAKVVWTIHNRVSHEAPWPRLEKWIQGRLAKAADRVIVHARSSLDELRGDFPLPDNKVSVIPHGHYRTAYGPGVDAVSARKELRLPESGRIYLFFGMLRPYKGIERLIRDWQSAMALDPSAFLVIAGQPLDELFLARLRESAAGSRSIEIRAGFVPPSQVPLFFSAADLVVLPFHKILTSGSLLLAMSYGKPVVAPRLAAIVEAVGEADDLLYDPEDPAALRQFLQLSSALPLQMIQCKTSRACEKLEWGNVAGLTLDAYRRAAASTT